MIEVAPTSSALTALTSAVKIAKSIIVSRDTAMVKEKTSELMSKILEAQQFAYESQSNQSRLSEEINLLKKEILAIKNWGEEKEKYFLQKINGVFVYSLKDEFINASTVFHQICVNCFENQKNLSFNVNTGILLTNHCQRAIFLFAITARLDSQLLQALKKMLTTLLH